MTLKEQILEYLEVTGVQSKPIQISNGVCGDYTEVRITLYDLKLEGLITYNHINNTFQIAMDKEYTEGTDIGRLEEFLGNTFIEVRMNKEVLFELIKKWERKGIAPETENGLSEAQKDNAMRKGMRDGYNKCADDLNGLIKLLE